VLILESEDFEGSCCSSFIMMEPSSHGNGDHLVWLLRGRTSKDRRLRHPLPTSLMRPGLGEGQASVREERVQVLLLQDQDLMQARSPHPEVAELDINPPLATSAGLYTLDALVILGS
jgi:hypothetical protein